MQGRLAEDRAEKLEELPNWTWANSRLRWRRKCDAVGSIVDLKRKRPENEEASIEDCVGGYLMCWVYKQRKLYKEGKLLDWQITEVEKIKGWRWQVPDTWGELREQ